MNDPIQPVTTDPWAGSPSRPSLPVQPLDPKLARLQAVQAEARAEARGRRKARWYGHYWAVATALFGVSAVAGLGNGDARGPFALLFAGATGDAVPAFAVTAGPGGGHDSDSTSGGELLNGTQAVAGECGHPLGIGVGGGLP